MSGNLYELLEINESASTEAISANFKRLQAKFSEQAANGDESARNLLIALREAHDTLSDPQRRQRYDQRLAARANQAEVLVSERRPIVPIVIALAIALLAGFGYAKHSADQEKTRLEREKVVATAKQAELDAQKEREARQAADQAEAKERSERARDIAYSAQITRDIQRAESQERYNRQREEQQRINEERQRVAEANRQLAKDKAYLRQLEAGSRY